jgi:hypothetical protein
MRASIELFRGNDSIAGRRKPEKHRGDPAHPRSEGFAAVGAFELGDRGDKGIEGGIRPARVDVPRSYLLAGCIGELAYVGEGVGRGQVEQGSNGLTTLLRGSRWMDGARSRAASAPRWALWIGFGSLVDT